MKPIKLKGKILDSIPKITVNAKTRKGKKNIACFDGLKSFIKQVNEQVIVFEIYPVTALAHKGILIEDYFVKIIKRDDKL